MQVCGEFQGVVAFVQALAVRCGAQLNFLGVQLVVNHDARAAGGTAQRQQFAVDGIRRAGEGHLDVFHGVERAVFQLNAEGFGAGFAFFGQDAAADLAHRDGLIDGVRRDAARRIDNFTAKGHGAAALVRGRRRMCNGGGRKAMAVASINLFSFISQVPVESI